MKYDIPLLWRRTPISSIQQPFQQQSNCHCATSSAVNLWSSITSPNNSSSSSRGHPSIHPSIPTSPSQQRAMPEQSNDYRVVVFGAGGVGKSSLVLRFVKGTFRESYIPTVEDTYRQVKKQFKWKLFRAAIFLDYTYKFKLAALLSLKHGECCQTLMLVVANYTCIRNEVSDWLYLYMHIGLVLINDVSS